MHVELASPSIAYLCQFTLRYKSHHQQYQFQHPHPLFAFSERFSNSSTEYIFSIIPPTPKTNHCTTSPCSHGALETHRRGPNRLFHFYSAHNLYITAHITPFRTHYAAKSRQLGGAHWILLHIHQHPIVCPTIDCCHPWRHQRSTNKWSTTVPPSTQHHLHSPTQNTPHLRCWSSVHSCTNTVPRRHHQNAHEQRQEEVEIKTAGRHVVQCVGGQPVQTRWGVRQCQWQRY